MTLSGRSKSRDSNRSISETGERRTRPQQTQKQKRARGYLRLQDLGFRTKWACRKLAKKGKCHSKHAEAADDMTQMGELSPPLSPASRKSDDDTIISEIYQPSAKQHYFDGERSKEVRNKNTDDGIPYVQMGHIEIQNYDMASNAEREESLESGCTDLLLYDGDEEDGNDIYNLSLVEHVDEDKEEPITKKSPRLVMIQSILITSLHTSSTAPIIAVTAVVVVMCRYRKDFRVDAIPWQVALMWNLFAFCLGRMFSFENRKGVQDNTREGDDDLDNTIARDVSIISSEKNGAENQASLQQRNTTFLRAMARASTRPAKIRSFVADDKQIVLPDDFFTTIYPPSVPATLTWVDKFNVPSSSLLFKRIPETTNKFHRHSIDKGGHTNNSVMLQRVSDNECSFRGMDILLTDFPQEKLYRNSCLNRCGLRSTPTMIVNILAPWASVIFYLRLPSWVKDFNNLKPDEDDSKEVQMLKHFLDGSDANRNRRLKIIPQLVEGPMPIRMLAQTKKNAIIKGTSLPLTWYKHSEYVDRHGNIQRAILEVDCDIASSSKVVRTSTSLLRRYMHLITVDLAFMLAFADDDGDAEAMPPSELKHSVCLGVTRVEKVIPEMCAIMPPLSETESIRHASLCIGLGEN